MSAWVVIIIILIIAAIILPILYYFLVYKKKVEQHESLVSTLVEETKFNRMVKRVNESNDDSMSY
jgi:uncharacterized protein YpmB